MAFSKLDECLNSYIKNIINEAHMNNDICNSMFESEQNSSASIPEIKGQKKLPDDYIDWIKEHICWDSSDLEEGYLMLGSDAEYDGKDADFLDSHDWGTVTDKYDWQVLGYKILFDPDSLEIQEIIPVVHDVKADTVTQVDTFLAPSGYEYDVRLTPDTAKQIESLATDYLNNNIDDIEDDDIDDDYFDVESRWEEQHRPYDKEDYDRWDAIEDDARFHYYDKY